MIAFTHEEQGDRKYLVYEKRAEDSMDTLTLEMISNNRIQGIAPLIHIQKDDSIYIKYDITGLKSFREYIQGCVRRQKLLRIMESIADAAIEAEDYMLKFSSYILNVDYIYLDSADLKVFMIVLPIVREEIPLEDFLKKLLMEVRYDQTEDCSYVAALLNFFSSSEAFSVYELKKRIVQFKQEKSSVKKEIDKKNEKSEPRVQKEQRTEIEKAPNEKPIVPNSPQKQHCLNVLFSNEEEDAPKKEKRSLFFRKEKQEKDENGKKEKKGFFARRAEKRQKIEEKNLGMDAVLGGIAIPGMDMPARAQDDGEEKEPLRPRGNLREQRVSVPAQNIGLNRIPVEADDFGETEWIGDEDDETAMLGQEDISGPEFFLYRVSTQETFRIFGEITRIGRSSTVAEICITGNKCVGRIHAFLHIRNGKVFIEDNHSKNKTYVDGIQLNPDSAIELQNGAKIRLGDEELEFRIEE